MESAGIRAAASILGKALSPLSDGVLEAWVASTELGSNMEDLKEELLQAQAMLHIVRGKEIHNPALAQLLDKLRQLAYRADDALDELDYFRIQDELDHTYHAADEHPGWVGNLTQNVGHTAKACVNKIKCSRAAKRNDPDDQDNSSKKGCFPALRLLGGCHEIGSSPPSPTKQPCVEEVHDPDEQDDGNRQGCLSGLRFCGRRHETGSSSPPPANQRGVEEVHGNVGSHAARPHDKEVFSRSCKLFHLRINTNTGVLTAPICNLLSSTLTKLDLGFDTEVQRLTEEQEEALQILTPLQELYFSYGIKLQRLPAGLHNLINLKKLTIEYCSSIRSLPSLPSSLQELQVDSCRAIKSLPNSLPNSLETLTIQYCRAIKSLPNSLPNSLETLTIRYCGAMKSLPKDGLPSSMRELDVKYGNSEELKRACRKLIGTIPIVRT